MLRRLIYTSACREPVTRGLLTDIQQASVRRNKDGGITGLLVVGGGCFFQVLEGTPAQVSTTFSRIEGDPRHGDALVLWDQPVPERLFPNWAMNWRELEENDPLTSQIVSTHRLAREAQAAIPEHDPVNILMSVFLDSLGH